SPIYPSPMHDFGYDISDYTAIHPLFGTLDDFDRLLADMHARGLKLILDLVPCHTSDAHPWFVQSRSGRENPRRDWYVWADPAADGGPPNNWLSAFGGPAWTLDARTGQYYLHTFLPQQPDLNYHNPDVVGAMENVMRFWLDRGVDGFRVDVMNRMVKDPLLRDEPPNPAFETLPPRLRTPFYAIDHIHTCHRPETHALVRRFRRVLDAYPERVMIGETHGTFAELAAYYGADNDACQLPFNFHLLLASPWRADVIRPLVEAYEAGLPAGAWPNYVLGNHDQHRLATRVGPAQARVAQMLLLTLRGTPTCYYGDELGMENVAIPEDKVCDPAALRMPERAGQVGRDPGRTPMQWNAEPNAGFCAAHVEPWLPVEDGHAARNVAAESADPRSMLHLFRALTALRRAEPALHGGLYATVPVAAENVYAYRRTAAGRTGFLVVLNFGGERRTLDLGHAAAGAAVAVATGLRRRGAVALDTLALEGHEGLLLRIDVDRAAAREANGGATANG
ncbi:MAG: DUF3459 domain-containing protein, partial [Lentisphaerae bacterium]|nr:DUF3459 domain-containing protein [Lentisphaerota bacterium]